VGEAARLVFEHIGDGEFRTNDEFLRAFEEATAEIGARRMPHQYSMQDTIGYAHAKGWIVRDKTDHVTVTLPPEWADEVA